MPEPRWLDAEQQQIWRAVLAGYARLNHQIERDLVPFGLSHPEYEVLVRLSESPQRRRRMADLARESLQSRSRLTHTVERLERGGLVRREACPGDGRGVLAVLTDQGFQTLHTAAVNHAEGVLRYVFDGASREDLAAVGRVFTAIAERLGEDGSRLDAPAV
ncbi:MAG TPA: MarR family transcriptional regulator [Mycobacteriales bacterium]|nr:MarR family transcriptional regulator [Mycobacteriales bacterium]